MLKKKSFNTESENYFTKLLSGILFLYDFNTL